MPGHIWDGQVELLCNGYAEVVTLRHFYLMVSCCVNMKLLLCLFFVSGSVAVSVAQSRPDIDTVTLYNLVPGITIKDIDPRVDAPLDTLVWDDVNHTGIIKFVRGYHGIHGEYRLAVDKGNVTQVIFTTPLKNADETVPMYKRLSDLCTGFYGEPDINYYNAPYREMRWEGMKQSVSVKTREGTTYVSLVLSKFEGRR